MECPSCRGENPGGARFCMSYGKSMSATCPECATELPAEARFCLNCGHQLGQAQADPARARLEQYIPRELLTKLETARTSGEPQGERRVVTMLFCDVTGSTAAERLRSRARDVVRYIGDRAGSPEATAA